MNAGFKRLVTFCTLGTPVLLAGLGTPVAAQGNPDFNWSVTPYLWATDTTVDLSFRDTNIGSGNVSFGDLVDALDAAFMIHAEGGDGHWSGFVDLTYLDTSKTNTRQALTIDSESEQIFLDVAAAWWPWGFGDNLNLYGGARYTSFSDSFRFRAAEQVLGEQNQDSDYADFLVGVRYRFDLSQRWTLLTQADTSFGESEGTWLARANIGYSVGKRRQNRILFGYQFKQAEFEDDDLTTDFTYKGAMTGFNFRF
ncbi:hypothetical protein QVZ43_13135 [Marinobacter sp. chi1]|uniref:Porin family protein n=1 Tax=Marinobacter suaedae TaxID=3057675 RepID=A0ABT8W356_9GAMM|nr:hypothetical protein [Marinobacter sp. chi1]MDO3722664.1 hypothetical protein [Marinobacter sp. chi1]